MYMSSRYCSDEIINVHEKRTAITKVVKHNNIHIITQQILKIVIMCHTTKGDVNRSRLNLVMYAMLVTTDVDTMHHKTECKARTYVLTLNMV